MKTLLASMLGLLAVLALAGVAAADVKITDRPYVRHDGGTDVTIASCSSDVTDPTPDAGTPTPAADEGGGERQQNEPAAAVDPLNPNRMTAGSNDYCSVPTTTDAYAGFYYSSDGGTNWTDSLLPGYPTDTSAEGSNCSITPQHCLVINTGDPVQAFDRWGHVFYGVIGFNRAKPQNGSIFAARYDWPVPSTTPDYRFTALVARGAPALSGKFEDKVQLEVDRGVNSPYAGSLSRPWGNVYICWAQFVGNQGNNGVYFSRSTDGGLTYSQPQKISEGVHGSQFCDIGVTSVGTVYVTWRSFEGRGSKQVNAVVVAKSTNGGATFTKPRVLTEFIPWDLGDSSAVPAEEREEAMEEACEQGDGIECAESGAEEEATSTRDCGDGPFVCESGYVFFREDSQTRITADPTDTDAPAGGVHRLQRNGSRQRDADRNDLRDRRAGDRQPGSALPDPDAGRHELVADADADHAGAGEGPPVLPGRRRERRPAPRRLAGQPQRHCDRAAEHAERRRLPHGADREPVGAAEPARKPGLGRRHRSRDVLRRLDEPGHELHRAGRVRTVADAAVRAVRRPRHPVLR